MVYNPDEVEKDYEKYNGGCWNCGKQLTLKEEETHCDNCGELIRWCCNGCHKIFDIVDKKTKDKLPICKLCGYFICPYCGQCSSTCKKLVWIDDTLKILREEIPIGKYPKLPQKAREIVENLINQKISIDRKNCPERNVPVSYAKGKIKSLLGRFEGFRVKDKEDRDAFIKRFDEITEKEIGTILTVTSAREKGSYGQEYRDAFNLGVCLGKFKIEKRKISNSEEEYDAFIRCENEPCEFLGRDDLIITYCPTCKKQFKKGTLYCDVCPPYKKGKYNGQLRKLKTKLNNKDTCQCYRGNFI